VRVIDWDFEQAPFFVEFEYGGVSLDRWLETIGSSAPLDARLALFIEAANAVAAAHGVGVLHKDLKPANLLVYGTPDDWHLRVADFGSSRVFEAGLLDNLGITRLGFTQTQVLSADTGTPLYMAPEVLGGQSPTIKSDVYALGLTLYQLIIGDFRRPLSAGWENDVTDPLLRRDVADAADGDPDKRLDSAAQLAARIRTLAERRQKAALEAAIKDRVAVAERRASLARARRPWVVAAMLLLIAGMTTSLYYARQSRQQTRRALAATNEATVEADKAKVADTKATSINTFLLQNVISASDPMRSGNHAITLQQALDQAEPKIHTSFAKQPDLEIEVRTLLADAYVAHGDWEHVLDQCNKIIALAAVHPNDATYVGQGNKARLRQAEALLFLGRLTEFDRAMAPLLKQVEDGNLTDPDVRYHAYYYAGQRTMMAGDYVRTVQLLQKAHNEVQMLHMPGQPDAEAGAKIQVDSELGQALGLAGRNDESLNLLTNLRKQVAASHGDAFPANLDVRDSLVGTEIAVGHYADAQRDLDSLRQDSNRVLGSDSSLSSHLDYNQGWIFVNQNLYAKAIPFYANAYATQRAQDGGSDPQTVMIGVQYADVTRIAGSMSQAQQVLETMDNDIRPLPGGTRAPLQAQVALVRGCLMVDQGRASQARALAQSLDASTVNSDDSAVKRLKGLRQSDDIQRITCALAMQG